MLVVSGLIHLKHLTIGKLDNHLDKKFKKGTNRTSVSPFLLKQGEPIMKGNKGVKHLPSNVTWWP